MQRHRNSGDSARRAREAGRASAVTNPMHGSAGLKTFSQAASCRSTKTPGLPGRAPGRREIARASAQWPRHDHRRDRGCQQLHRRDGQWARFRGHRDRQSDPL